MERFLNLKEFRRFRITSAVLLITGIGCVFGLYGVLVHAVARQQRTVQSIQKKLIDREIERLKSEAQLALSRFAYSLHQMAGRDRPGDLSEFYNWSTGRTDGFMLFDEEGRKIAAAGVPVSADSFQYCLASTAPQSGLHNCPVSGNSVIYVVANDPLHPPRFRLVFFRKLGPALARRISELTGLPLRFVPLNQTPPTLKGYHSRSLVLTDFHGKPLLQMVSYYPQVYAHQARNFLLAIGLLILLIAVLIFSSTSMQQLSGMAGQLKDQNASLNRLAHQRTRLLRTLSHDLNNYLASAQGYLEMALMDENLSPLLKSYLKNVLQAIQVEAEVISMVRQQLSVEQNRLASQTRPVCLAHLLEQSLANFKLRLEKKKLRVIQGPGVHDFVVQVDPIFFVVNVLNNLISNAIKFSPPEAAISISVQPDGEEWVQLSICDAGQGMAPEQVQQILNGGPVRSRPGTGGEVGTGLGLAQVLEVVHQFGGTLTIESPAGAEGGTCFHLRLPRVPGDCRSCREGKEPRTAEAPLVASPSET
ncbi:MAG: hypothetical protein D6715_03110 [Calditrichaeota bacterium]|nr:MAG: hypothetical protein D6715_03110 [Calditrichota bacterium]